MDMKPAECCICGKVQMLQKEVILPFKMEVLSMKLMFKLFACIERLGHYVRTH